MRRTKEKRTAATQLRGGCGHPFGAIGGYVPLNGGAELYGAMREALPVLDAAVCKLVRLAGGFTVACGDRRAQAAMDRFVKTVPVGRGQFGLESFLAAYLDSLLTYGRAVGEVAVAGGRAAAVCWGDVTKVEIREGDSPLDFQLCCWDGGELKPLPYPELLLFTTLNPEPASPYGVSMLRSMPFLADILLKIYNTIGVNWERAGNVRYSVVYKPGGDPADRMGAAERAQEMASQWGQAMQESRSGVVRDFVAVGDVEIKVIGADGQILDSQVPVRQILEQLISRTGLPPFLLGLSWSSTERMSAQQADLLTSELWALRRAVEPALRKACGIFLRLEGFGGGAEIVWEDISLQDIVEESHARLYRAQAERLEGETGK